MNLPFTHKQLYPEAYGTTATELYTQAVLVQMHRALIDIILDDQLVECGKDTSQYISYSRDLTLELICELADDIYGGPFDEYGYAGVPLARLNDGQLSKLVTVLLCQWLESLE